MLATLAISFWASSRVKSSFNRFAAIPASSGLTGAQTAQRILHAHGISDVEVVPVEGHLTDHYDPSRRILALSEPVYSGRSIAALGVAAHECGHALQHQAHYAPLHLRMGAVGITNFASSAVSILPLLGMGLGFMTGKTMLIVMGVCWAIILGFNLITLPVEYDASSRAKAVLGKLGIIQSGSEAEGVNKVLGAAALTYVAAFLTSLGYLVWHLLPLLTGGRRSDD